MLNCLSFKCVIIGCNIWSSVNDVPSIWKTLVVVTRGPEPLHAHTVHVHRTSCWPFLLFSVDFVWFSLDPIWISLGFFYWCSLDVRLIFIAFSIDVRKFCVWIFVGLWFSLYFRCLELPRKQSGRAKSRSSRAAGALQAANASQVSRSSSQIAPTEARSSQPGRAWSPGRSPRSSARPKLGKRPTKISLLIRYLY